MAICTKEEIATLKNRLKRLKLQLLYTKQQLEATNRRIPPTTLENTWCLDYKTDIPVGTDVGTIEITGERKGGLNIQPDYLSGSPGNVGYLKSRDGQIGPMANNTPAAWWLNYARLPGWQKLKPTSRYGTINSIDYDTDTCTVWLDNATSSAQDLPINQTEVLEKVPIDYMFCNDIFLVGDRVVVLFTDQEWEKPIVRGFESNPKSCFWEAWPGPDWCSAGNQWQILAWFFSGSSVTEYLYGGSYGWDACPVDKKDLRFLIDLTGFHVNFTVPAGFATGFNSRVKVVPPVIPGTFTKMVFSGDFASSDETFVRIVFKDSAGAATTANTVLLHFNFGATPPDPAYITPPSFTTGNISYTDEEVDISSISQPFQQIEIIHVCGSAGNTIDASIKYIDFR